jgi:hypothetical protein
VVGDGNGVRDGLGVSVIDGVNEGVKELVGV